MEKDLLDELLDLLYKCGASVSTETITKQLVDFYVKSDSGIPLSQKEALEAKARYLINKHQIALMKTIVADNK